ncbi:putative gnat family acetyltransferase protein [Botrytis fragariae]|uniref:Putative gnat family acetyltransferase protein n=1 Tax=Botrytis fragariae TaxID=1964551 RepID=A0A8H6B246_9HELO|nr:putative gnat family acetyltransferase protein [Botrytis fragariae]KAF5877672.1 putative gnat family acetyltransferase protein [Botrytis fragariae]
MSPPPIPPVSLYPADFETSFPTVSPNFPPFPSLTPLSHATNRISLVPLSADHIPDLWKHVGGAENYMLYKYMPSGPFNTIEDFTAYLTWLINYSEFSFINWAIILPSGEAVGIISLLNIVPDQRRIEVGHVLFSKILQRTTEATEACFVLMEYCFKLGYERVEWKCNAENMGSKRAAERLGFVAEGLFRRHMVVRGRRRDSWYGSVILDEWEGVREALVEWLKAENFDEKGGQKRKVEEIRGELLKKFD